MNKLLNKNLELTYQGQQGLFATVNIIKAGDKADTYISIYDDMDYEFCAAKLNKALSEDEVEKYLEKGFAMAVDLGRPPSKYGEKVPTIEL
ncbi:hypothetical protein [Vibrio crassostreae]|uniref:hypothetical protein n=1 Tax=Vibrio crassostreae TaxID=246167 RepID=UPI001B30F84A|nr:hypothetical protein [Vibrio crassostreae]